MKEQFSIVELPSHLLPYDNISEVRVRPFSVLEIKGMANAANTINQEQRMIEVLSNCVEGIDIRNLTMGDFFYVMHWIRYNSFTNFVPYINLKCSSDSCDFEDKVDLTMDMLKVIDLPDDYYRGLEVKLPSAGIVKIRLQTVGDETNARKLLEEHFKLNKSKKIDNGDIFNAILALMIEPNGGSFSERFSLINDPEKFTPEDLFVLRGVQDYFKHGIDDTVEIRCPKCGEVQKIGYKPKLSSFFPTNLYRDYREAIRSAIIPASKS